MSLTKPVAFPGAFALERVFESHQDSSRIVRLAGEYSEVGWTVQVQRRVIKVHYVEHIQELSGQLYPLPFRDRKPLKH